MPKELLSNLLKNIKSIDIVYRSAIYGASHKEARIIHILAKFGSKHAQNKLSDVEFAEVLGEIEAIDNAKGLKTFTLELTSKEVTFVRNVMRGELRDFKRIPAISREQAIISLMLIFEGFVNDLLREIFENNTDALKSTKSTLKDEELIETLATGNTLERLIDTKLRDLMYGSVEAWVKYFQNNLGFDMNIQKDIVELNLVRNCIIHNNGLVSYELEKMIKKRRYIYAKQINVTEKDYDRYKNVVETFARKMWAEHVKKSKKPNVKRSF